MTLSDMSGQEQRTREKVRATGKPLASLNRSPRKDTPMFLRRRPLQYHAKPDRPDPIFAKVLQEPLGGQWGEIG